MLIQALTFSLAHNLLFFIFEKLMFLRHPVYLEYRYKYLSYVLPRVLQIVWCNIS